MATPVKLIEKEFLLKVLFDEQIPVIYHKDRIDYSFYLEEPAKKELRFRCGSSIAGLKARENIELKFDYRGKVIVFTAKIISTKKEEISCTIPDFLYKDLGRSFSRVSVPSEMKINFNFLGDRYDLSFPKVQQFDSTDLGNFFQNIDHKNFSSLIEQMGAWIKKFATDYKLVIFKNTRPSSIEERVIAETGKALYLPSTRGSFPQDDPYPRKRIITEEIFYRYLESTGVGAAFLESVCARFIKQKVEDGILSDAWIPILFQEYVIGYVHIWISTEGRTPFDYKVIDTMYLFTKVLAHSLEISGFFEQGKIKNNAFNGGVIDISVSGLSFSCPNPEFLPSLLPNSRLTINISTPYRSVTANAVIVRRFKDGLNTYFGCQFSDMSEEDRGYLFEIVYGKPYTEEDAKLLSGQV